jgi:uncharacterized protein YndB with AHSA1/START domain
MSDGQARAIADVSAGLILATVTIAVPPERIFRALTDPAELPKWWGSDDMYRTTAHAADLRPGGSWRSEGTGSDGTPFFVEGEYLEIEPPRRLVMTWKAPWDGGNVTTITYTLEPVAAGTKLTVRHEGFADRAGSCRSHSQGWPRVLGWLNHYLDPAAKAAAASAQRVFLCRLIPPRPDFAFTMSEAEKAVMAAHADFLRGLLRDGRGLIFGPVADPAGPWGLGLIRAESEEAARALTDADPTSRSGLGFHWEILPMLSTLS